MGAVMARLGGDGRAREQRVFACYDTAVGPAMRNHSQPEKLLGTTLVVRTSSSALAHRLTLLRAEILESLAKSLGPGKVTDLRTRVGPLRAR